MHLRYFFKESPNNNIPSHPFKLKSDFTPPLPDNENLLEFISLVYKEIHSHSNTPTNIHKNYSREQISALNNLQKNDNLIVKPADKGGAIVIWPRDDYIHEASKQLANTTHYNHISTNPIPELITRIRQFVHNNHKLGQFDYTTFKFVMPPTPTKTPTLYLLPKIHKAGNPGRPIISGCDGPTVRLSKYADHFLKPLVSNIPSFVKDSTDFLRRIFKLNHNLPNDIILLTIDVRSLYTNIPHDDGIAASIEYLQRFNSEANTDFLQEILTLVLHNNYFEFDNKYYLQTQGTAMGSPMAPSYANLFMGQLEHNMLRDAPGGLIPLEWIRFIDDIFAIWTHGIDKLKEFLHHINNFHPTIKFEIEYSYERVHFLDTNIYINNLKQLESDLFIKPTDKALLLHNESFHPNNCKISIIYSQALRYVRLITNRNRLSERLQDLRVNLITRGYTNNIIDNAFNKALQYTQSNLLIDENQENNNNNKTVRIDDNSTNQCPTNEPNSNKPILTFSVPYNTNTTHIGSILRKYWHLIDQDPSLKLLWPEPPLVFVFF